MASSRQFAGINSRTVGFVFAPSGLPWPARESRDSPCTCSNNNKEVARPVQRWLRSFSWQSSRLPLQKHVNASAAKLALCFPRQAAVFQHRSRSAHRGHAADRRSVFQQQAPSLLEFFIICPSSELFRWATCFTVGQFCTLVGVWLLPPNMLNSLCCHHRPSQS